MSEATHTLNPNRVIFSSAGAVRRHCSPRSRPSLPRPLTARDLTDDILKSHRHLVDRLAKLPPNTIGATLCADEQDLTLRADTLRCHLLAMQQYAIAYMRDTAAFTPHAIDTSRARLDGLFRDIIGDLCGAIENAADRVREGRAA